MDIITTLPNEILDNIFYYCDLVDIRNIMQCNKHLYNLADFDYFVKFNTYNVNSQEQYSYIRVSQTTCIMHGLYRIFHHDLATIAEEYTYEYGYREGMYKKYNMHGDLIECGNMTHNKYNGMFYMYYDNGNIYKEILYKEHCMDGIYKRYDINGSIVVEAYYKDNTLTGPYREYYHIKSAVIDAPRRLCAETMYVNGSKHGLHTAYDINGNITETIMYKYGDIDGEHNIYVNNQLRETITYKEGWKYGPHIKYYDNNKVYTETNYVDSIINGICNEYYKNGKLRIRLTYINGLIHGPRYEYYNNGKLSTEAEYNKDHVISIKYYRRNGILFLSSTKK